MWLTHFKLLLWKNFVISKRKPWGSCCTLITPMFIVGILVAVRNTPSIMDVFLDDNAEKTMCPSVLSPFDTLQAYNPPGCNEEYTHPNQNPSVTWADKEYDRILYVPKTTETDEVMGYLREQMSAAGMGPCPTNSTFRKFWPESDFNKLTYTALCEEAGSAVLLFGPAEGCACIDLVGSDSEDDAVLEALDGGVAAVIVFRGSEALPSDKKVNFDIRMRANLPEEGEASNEGDDRWLTNVKVPESLIAPIDRGDNPYLSGQFANGFLFLENAIGAGVAKYYSPSKEFPKVLPRLTSFPFPAYEEDGFLGLITGLLPTILIYIFVYPAQNIARELVIEKEERLREAMAMIGLSSGLNYAAWWTKHMLFLSIMTVIVSIMFSAGELLRFTEPFCVFLLFEFTALAIVSYGFLMSTFFKSANVGGATSAILWILLAVPYSVVQQRYGSLSASEKAGVCLAPPSALNMGFKIIEIWEDRGNGVTLDNMSDNPTENDNFSFADVIGMLLLDSIIMMFLAWYFDKVLPREYGVPESPFFLFKASYWNGKNNAVEAMLNPYRGGMEQPQHKNSSFEDMDPNAEVGVQISNLWKAWPTPLGSMIAVEDLSLSAYKGEVTALLGHNGAGKTTTLSILTGMYMPSQGSVKINGHDVVHDTNKARESLGLCPQFDILFRELTVREHLYFFLKLKGVTDKTYVEEQIKTFLKDVDLEAKANTRSKNLSGGQKRGLSVALALIGGPQTVILDEPTSGMDPQKRRHTWDLILKHKEGRTILLTTHFMDEADLLGDRVAIMTSGKLSTVGTPTFLKSRYGVGYHLTLAKGNGFNDLEVKKSISTIVPDAAIQADVGAELSYVVPQAESSKFPALFADLENKKDEYGIESIGCSCSTMEEVFLKVGDMEHEKEMASEGESESDNLFAAKSNIYQDSTPKERNTGGKLWRQKFYALFKKRMIHSSRYVSTIIAQTIIPALFVFAALAIDKWALTAEDATAQCKTLNNIGDDILVTSYDSSFGGMGYSQSGEALGDTTKAYYDGATISFSEEANMTEKLLKSADDYLNTRFFETDIISTSFSGGTLWFSNVGGSCMYSDVNPAATTSSASMTAIPSTMILRAGAAYAFQVANTEDTDLKFWRNASMDPDTQITSVSELPSYFGASSETFSVSYVAIEQTTLFSMPTLPETQQDVYMSCGNNILTKLEVGEDAGANIDNGESTLYAWYSPIPFHSVAETLTAATNIIFRHSVSDSEANINIRNCPLPKTTEEIVKDTGVSNSFSIAWWLAMALSFLAASFLFFPVNERKCHSKHVQFISGADEYVYWLSAFTWDCINMILPLVLIVIIFAAFNLEDLRGDQLGMVVLLLILGLPAMLPTQYLLSFVFENSSVAYAMSILFFLLLNTVALLVVAILSIPSFSDKTRQVGADLHIFFLFNPQYAIASGVARIYDNHYYLGLCKEFLERVSGEPCPVGDDLYDTNYFKFQGASGIGMNILFCIVDLVLWGGLLLFVEYTKRKQFSTMSPKQRTQTEDSDVAAERQRIEGHTDQLNDQLIVSRLTRKFKKFTAVDDLTFGVPAGECFGLLGVNGAGKTTTFRMMTGEISMSTGSIFIDGKNIRTNLKEVRQRIGYCPQYDGLIGTLTGRELLEMYARLRGVPEENIDVIVTEAIDQLDLRKHCDRLSGTYSGGNKRKLATALALVGSPSIVFLDEPTSGMDPGARRFLWNVLASVTRGGKSIILTSHSMEECEALCTRLTIMKAGRMHCLGTLQQIKSKFGTGYTVIAKLTRDGDSGPLKNFMKSNLQAQYKSEHNGEVTFRIGENYKLSQIFALIEGNKDNLGLIDYSVSQTSLEQVFLGIASGNASNSDQVEVTI
eukprot:m.332823 g.332823  ORF g.332823 m.332823 type:complete len:1854 (-) comp17014_c0_seq1:237-5798(-)